MGLEENAIDSLPKTKGEAWTFAKWLYGSIFLAMTFFALASPIKDFFSDKDLYRHKDSVVMVHGDDLRDIKTAIMTLSSTVTIMNGYVDKMGSQLNKNTISVATMNVSVLENTKTIDEHSGDIKSVNRCLNRLTGALNAQGIKVSEAQ